ncbi:H(+)-transporting V0 sector ATPase subunit d [Elasticomyces elasticus]|nr:H(+)-transporting V0 sector ATPase subunit d [Elasticomyces elasticus]KAK3658610.1 H(+)-transporting V0 sector ATPase subunit d [Elasticomyces elasticus]KAK4911382.1 H(+)-transporting V0 sector ATPase subunit d [Elasticomyces elasticus]KAK5747042.1 H(+)-transporting V0 sector ATPase subunit d [Elasticomyces elasticus]
MEGMFYNITGGYVEGIVRGYRNTLLTSQNYGNLTQCETIDDVKLQLGPAYGDFLASLPPNPSTSSLADKTLDKLVAEFRYVQANATGSLSKFMDYLTYAYMIDNVALLITGTLHERDTRELLERCHPLGWFETMPVLCVATNIEELYNSVLIETPLAPYFKGSLSHQDLDELNIEIVRNTLYKNYLEDFHRFVNEEPGIKGTPTQEVMSEALEFEADRRSINITLNSFGTELTKQDRRKLYPNFGRLHPEGTLMLSRAEDAEGVRIAVDGVSDYRDMMDQTGMSGGGGGIGNQSGGMGGDTEGKSLEDMFYAREMQIAKMSFTFQFTHAIVYAWVKLREQSMALSQDIPTRFLIIPDTHGQTDLHLPTQEVDVVIHCGDLTEHSKLCEFEATLDLIKRIKAPLKLVIAGNHDFSLDLPMFRKKIADVRPPLDPDLVKREYGDAGEAKRLLQTEDAKSAGIVYLEEGTHTFTLANGARLKVYASPYTPSKADWGFEYDPQQEEHKWSIDNDTDVVMTHGPPKGVLDFASASRQRVGSPGLFAAVARARPRMHCFGHIHEAWGAKQVVWREEISETPSHFTDIDNDASRSYDSLSTIHPRKFDGPEEEASKVEKLRQLREKRYCSASSSVESGQTLFVNAAMEGEEERVPWVVDIALPKASL